jgi:hypothetical protein
MPASTIDDGERVENQVSKYSLACCVHKEIDLDFDFIVKLEDERNAIH